MNTNQQHLLDAYRAAQRGELAPPQPGRHDWEALGEIRDHLRTGRPDARRRRKGWLRRLLSASWPTP
ncbi:hypothetical protein [Streptomyces sp. NPDC088348]|uniref:hypothetical protein n=1 Tax=Streptomyces sp. NPDC088348 TaxID=3365853 RepID=UPI00381B3274